MSRRKSRHGTRLMITLLLFAVLMTAPLPMAPSAVDAATTVVTDYIMILDENGGPQPVADPVVSANDGRVEISFTAGVDAGGSLLIRESWLQTYVGRYAADRPFDLLQQDDEEWLSFDFESGETVELALAPFTAAPGTAGWTAGDPASISLGHRPMHVSIDELSTKRIQVSFNDATNEGQPVAVNFNWLREWLGEEEIAFGHETLGYIPHLPSGDHAIITPPHFSFLWMEPDVDSDGDGIYNYAETVRVGTNYTLLDTDGDGVNDHLDVEPLYNTALALDIWNITGAEVASGQQLYVQVSIPSLLKGTAAKVDAADPYMVRFHVDIPDDVSSYAQGALPPSTTINARATEFEINRSAFYLDIRVGVCYLSATGAAALPLGAAAEALSGVDKLVEQQWTHFNTTLQALDTEAVAPSSCSQIVPNTLTGNDIDYIIVRYDVIGGRFEVLDPSNQPASCLDCNEATIDFLGRRITGSSGGLSLGCCRVQGNLSLTDSIGNLIKPIELGEDDVNKLDPFPCTEDGCGEVVPPCDPRFPCQLPASAPVPGDLDQDDDGLLSLTETGVLSSFALTDPFRADTDDDGWPDGFEQGMTAREAGGAFTALNTQWLCTLGVHQVQSGRYTWKSWQGTIPSNARIPNSASNINDARDTDNDGVPDGYEDTDYDGIYDVNLEMSPTTADTDSDTLRDGREVLIFDGFGAAPGFCGVRAASYSWNNQAHQFALSPTLGDSDEDGVLDNLDIEPTGGTPQLRVVPKTIVFGTGGCSPDDRTLEDNMELYTFYRIDLGSENLASGRIPGGEDYYSLSMSGTQNLPNSLIKSVSNLPQSYADYQAKAPDPSKIGIVSIREDFRDEDPVDDDKLDIYGLDTTGSAEWRLIIGLDLAMAVATATFPEDTDTQTWLGEGATDGRACVNNGDNRGLDAKLTLETIDNIKAWFFDQAALHAGGSGIPSNPNFLCYGTPNCGAK